MSALLAVLDDQDMIPLGEAFLCRWNVPSRNGDRLAATALTLTQPKPSAQHPAPDPRRRAALASAPTWGTFDGHGPDTGEPAWPLRAGHHGPQIGLVARLRSSSVGLHGHVFTDDPIYADAIDELQVITLSVGLRKVRRDRDGLVVSAVLDHVAIEDDPAEPLAMLVTSRARSAAAYRARFAQLVA